MHNTMKLNRKLLPIGITALLLSCGGASTPEAGETPTKADQAATAPAVAQTTAYPEGFIQPGDLVLNDKIDTGMVAEANKIFNTKCHVCHSKTDQKVVGPGWKGVINERKPEWIMNMILHTQWMVENDTAAQNLVVLTKTVMPDQQLSKEQARAMLELIRTL